LADIVVVSADLRKASEEELKRAKVEMTIVGGKVVYRGAGE